MKKPLFEVTLNWHDEVHTFYRYAKNERNALTLSIRALAKEVGFFYAPVHAYITDAKKDRWKVSMVNK